MNLTRKYFLLSFISSNYSLLDVLRFYLLRKSQKTCMVLCAFLSHVVALAYVNGIIRIRRESLNEVGTKGFLIIGVVIRSLQKSGSLPAFFFKFV